MKSGEIFERSLDSHKITPGLIPEPLVSKQGKMYLTMNLEQLIQKLKAF